MVAVEASSLVAYITKFTEESFASLVAIIFMFEAVKNLTNIAGYEEDIGSSDEVNDAFVRRFQPSSSSAGSDEPESPTNVFLLSILLFLGTFFMSFILKEFRTSPFFPTRVRYIV